MHLLLLKYIYLERGDKTLTRVVQKEEALHHAIKKYKAHEIRLLGWDLGRTGLTGNRGFALEQGSVFIVQCKPNNKI